MNLQVEHIANHLAQLTVVVDAKQTDEAKRKAAQRLGKQVRVPGFRPGKAPYNVVARMLGEEAILEEAVENLADKTYKQALEASNIDPVAMGTLVKYETDAEGVLSMIFNVPKQPEIDLKEYRELRRELVIEPVTDEMLRDSLEDLREEHAVVEEVQRAAQVGRPTQDRLAGALVPCGRPCA
ncbi:MAG: trigger factor family protein [Anaerolineae bacterium]|nr:trigger factor family protein [Anaerolineae bacterium]